MAERNWFKFIDSCNDAYHKVVSGESPMLRLRIDEAGHYEAFIELTAEGITIHVFADRRPLVSTQSIWSFIWLAYPLAHNLDLTEWQANQTQEALEYWKAWLDYQVWGLGEAHKIGVPLQKQIVHNFDEKHKLVIKFNADTPQETKYSIRRGDKTIVANADRDTAAATMTRLMEMATLQ